MKHPAQSYFLVSQEDIYKIDSLVGALNFAISEILERRPVLNPQETPTPHQERFDAEMRPYLYPVEQPKDRQSEFDF